MYVPKVIFWFSIKFIDYTFLDHDKMGSRSMRHGRFATSPVATIDASAISCYFKIVVHHQSVLIHGLPYR